MRTIFLELKSSELCKTARGLAVIAAFEQKSHVHSDASEGDLEDEGADVRLSLRADASSAETGGPEGARSAGDAPTASPRPQHLLSATPWPFLPQS